MKRRRLLKSSLEKDKTVGIVSDVWIYAGCVGRTNLAESPGESPNPENYLLARGLGGDLAVVIDWIFIRMGKKVAVWKTAAVTFAPSIVRIGMCLRSRASQKRHFVTGNHVCEIQ